MVGQLRNLTEINTIKDEYFREMTLSTNKHQTYNLIKSETNDILRDVILRRVMGDTLNWNSLLVLHKLLRDSKLYIDIISAQWRKEPIREQHWLQVYMS